MAAPSQPLPSALDAAGAPRPEALNSDGTVKTAADALIDGVFKALFLPGFTLAPTVNRRKDGTFFIIWCAAGAPRMRRRRRPALAHGCSLFGRA